MKLIIDDQHLAKSLKITFLELYVMHLSVRHGRHIATDVEYRHPGRGSWRRKWAWDNILIIVFDASWIEGSQERVTVYCVIVRGVKPCMIEERTGRKDLGECEKKEVFGTTD